MSVTRIKQGPVSTIFLDFDQNNLMTYERIQEIIKAHIEADNDPETRVIVTRSKREGVFSLGFNPKYIVDAPLKKRGEIFKGIPEMMLALLSLKRPHITVVDGPAIAGGAVLAALSDYRLFENESGKISFSEAKVGLALPDALIEVLRNFVTPSFIREVSMGKNINASLALEKGLSNWNVDKNNLEEKLAEECSKLARLSPFVLETTKKNINKLAIEKTQNLLDNFSEFEVFMGDDLLGEGLLSLVEQRSPNFLR